MKVRTNKTVLIFGAGIAGLTAAHELMKRGYRIRVIESLPEAGGFFRSSRREEDQQMPSEYSWHGMGPWYHNVFDLLSDIPYDEESSLYDKILSRPIDFSIAPDEGEALFDDGKGWTVNVKKMFRMNELDKWKWRWTMLKAWSSCQRSIHLYSAVPAKEAWGNLSPVAYRTWISSFGPWIGSDWYHVSLHTAAHFYRHQLLAGDKHVHKADAEGESWIHQSRSGWLLLNGPSSEVWFSRWVQYLKKNRVEFCFNQSLETIHYDGFRITGVTLDNKKVFDADYYVAAINPFIFNKIINKTKPLLKIPELAKFQPLTSNGPHFQVSLRVAFEEKINWPRKRCALVIADSAFNLTLFAQEQVWKNDINLGPGIRSLWTITACVSKQPGTLHQKPLEKCSREQFIEEVLYQLEKCESLSRLIKMANNGRNWTEFRKKQIEIWHEWEFSENGLSGGQPKWVNTFSNQPYLPDQQSGISNLMLAGAHTKTTADVWSIEAAVESGRLAARLISPDIKVQSQSPPPLLKFITLIDDIFYFWRLPHVYYFFFPILILLLILVAGSWFFS